MTRAFLDVLAALDRKRGKGGQQVVRVKRVMIGPGGQAVVGNVTAGAAGDMGQGWDVEQEPRENLMHRLPNWRMTLPLAQSCPRCGAQTRAGTPCRSPAMPNGRCRMHGGGSTGPRTAAGLERVCTARTKHGLYGAELRDLRQECAKMRAEARRWREKF